MSLKIIQWNIRGYTSNYSELQLLIKKYETHIIALQETHIKNPNNIPSPVNFTLLSHNYSNSFGGTTLLINKSIQSKEIPLSKEFDASCAEIESIKKFKIISAYIPPSKKFLSTDLHNVLNQHPIKLILGDFNSWGTNWCSPANNSRGTTVQSFLDNSNLILLNDKSPTHFSTHNTYTHIDLSFGSPELTIDA